MGLAEGLDKMTTGTEQLHREKGDTWPKVLRYNHEKYGDTRTAMRHKHYGIWQPYTWKDYYLNVKTLTLGLISSGLEPGDKVLIVGDNAPEWYYAELAAQAAHAVSVGAYSELTPTEILYIAQNSEAAFAVVQDQEQVDKLLLVKDALPRLKKVVFWNYKGLANYGDSILMGFREAFALGRKHEAEHPGLFERTVEAGKANDVCAIVYTSGTTGEAPKGAVHTYGTLRAGAEYHLHLDPWHDHDNIVPHLPPVWINEQWISIGCHLLSASTLNFAEGPETQQRDSREVGPSIVCRGARLWESQAAMVRTRISSVRLLNRLAFLAFMPAGNQMAESAYRKKKSGLLWKIFNSFVDRAFFVPIRRSLGLQNARVCYTTGAILSPEAFQFYHALNLPLKSLYGSTEGGALTGANNDDIQWGTVGPPHKGTEVTVTDDGEIIYRQPGTFIGYYNEPDRTAEVMQDGWFYSGDRGFIRDDGHLVLVDRGKDLVQLANGDTLVPQLAESRLRLSPYIKDAWILAGPEGAYASAIIVINYDTVGNWAGEKRVPYSTFAELAQRPEAYELVKQDIERANRTLSPGSRVKKFVNLHKEFDPDEGELTRNRKLRRTFLEGRYRELVEAIYDDQEEASIEAWAGHGDGGKGPIKTTIRIQSVEGGTG
ncbi:MAG: AMP-binding protein [Deltaproteobacteria bacterium]|nr:AMP-binding protein [Deltaproteobacteria bacterium]